MPEYDKVKSVGDTERGGTMCICVRKLLKVYTQDVSQSQGSVLPRTDPWKSGPPKAGQDSSLAHRHPMEQASQHVSLNNSFSPSSEVLSNLSKDRNRF